MYVKVLLILLTGGVLSGAMLTGAVLVAAGCRRAGAPEVVPQAVDVPAPEVNVGLGRRIRELALEGATLEEAIQALRDCTGARIDVRWEVLAATEVGEGWPRDWPVELKLREVTFASALEALALQCGPRAQLSYGVDGRGVIVISTAADPHQEVGVGREYDVADLLTDEYWEPQAGWRRTPGGAPRPAGGDAPEVVAARRLNSLRVALAEGLRGAEFAGVDPARPGRLVVAATSAQHRRVEQVLRQLRLRAGAPANSAGTEGPARDTPARRELAHVPGEAAAALARDNPREVHRKNVTVRQALDVVRDVAGANIVVDWAGLREAGVNPETRIDLWLWKAPLYVSLEVLMRRAAWHDEAALVAAARGEFVFVGLDYRLERAVEPRVYDVRRLLGAAPRAGNWDVFQGPHPDDLRTYFGLVDALLRLITSRIRPYSWHGQDGSVATGTIGEWGGRLIVTHTPGTHAEVERLLSKLTEDFEGAGRRKAAD